MSNGGSDVRNRNSGKLEVYMFIKGIQIFKKLNTAQDKENRRGVFANL